MLNWFPKRAASAAPPPAQSVEALFQRGNQLASSGDFAGAAVAFGRAARLRPDLKAAHFNHGSACRDSGDLEEAAAAYRRAADLDPAWADAQFALGQCLRELGRFDEAIAPLSSALAVQPGLAEAHVELGHACTATGDWHEAVSHFRTALALDPAHLKARWAFAVAQIPGLYDGQADPAARRSAFEAELEPLSRAVREAAPRVAAQAVAVHQPFFLAYRETDNRDLLARYGATCTGAMGAWQAEAGLAPPRAATGRAKRRIGIVSAQIYDHSVWGALTRGWVERLDRRRFEVHLFHLDSRHDAETRFAESQATSWSAGTRPFEEWAHRIHGARLDVALYPEIGMHATTGKLASLRLAPVQAVSWGHPETSGLPSMDFYLSAEDLEPPGAEAHYTEQLVKLPHLGCSVSRREFGSDPAAFAALQGEGPILVCPGMAFKYAPEHDRVLVEIARRLGACRLVFFQGRPAALAERLRERLRRAFAAAGLELERHAVFLPWQSLQRFRGLMSRADLYLDTLGFSGFNTALQAIDCGLPVVAREGRFLRGRLASGLLKRLELPELVAPSDDAYIELVVGLARDRARRESLAQAMAQRRERLFDDPAPVAALQTFLERV
jgi:predicted O-linked N-acetylglucosamine transferase (SPINDLY family)